MTELIEINTESVRQAASSIEELGTENTEIITKIGALVDSMSDWQGEAQQAFAAKYTSMKPIFIKFSEALNEYAAAISEGAVSMEETDNELASLFSSISGT